MDNTATEVNIEPSALNEVLFRRLSASQMEVIKLEAYVGQLVGENDLLKAELNRLKTTEKENEHDRPNTGD